MIVIENLEPPSEWLFYEYEHAYSLVGNELVITNVKHEELKKFLDELGVKYYEKSVTELLNEFPKPWVVLDPKGEKVLKPEEAKGTVIVGGILGAHPPKGRTWKELTSKLPKEVLVRNIGKDQFSIDGAVAVAYLISKGIPFDKIQIVKGLTVKVGSFMGMEVVEELPYAYPIIDGEVFISKKVIEYLKRKPLVG